MAIRVSDSENARALRDGTRIRSVARASRILALVAEREGCTATLVGEGLLDKDSGRQYHLGPSVGWLADAFARRLAAPERLTRQLRRLADTTGETALASSWRNGEITVLAAVEGRTAVRVAGLHSGYTAHAHARSAGKLLLALAPDHVRDGYLATHRLTPLTDCTIVDRPRLLEELAAIETRGFAIDREEFREGVACVSAPVRDHDVVSAALSLSAPVERFARRREEYTEAVLEAARAVSTGGR